MAKKRSVAAEPAARTAAAAAAPLPNSNLVWKAALVVGVVALLVGLVLHLNEPSAVVAVKAPKPVKLSLAQVRARAAQQPCQDRHVQDDFCTRTAASGECEEGKGWVAVMCAASCARCDLLDPQVRCSEEHMGVKLENAMRAGDMNALFERLIQLPNVDVLHRGEPWVVLVRDFISEKESSTLLQLTLSKLKRSTDQGEVAADGFQTQVVSQHRTSSNSWCVGKCDSHPVVVNLTERISHLVGVPTKNFEQYQVLQYEKTQKYDQHHDSHHSEFEKPAGPRVLTFFMYLSDVEEGGETAFPLLGFKVKPVKGAAVLWPSVKSAHPDSEIEPLTAHAALPVIKGVKYGANSWIHLREYKTPNVWGCTGSFD